MEFQTRHGTTKITTNQLIIVVVIAFLLFGTGVGTLFASFVNQNTGGVGKQLGIATSTGALSTSAAGAQGVSCNSATPWAVQQKPLAYGSDTLAGTAAENAYVYSSGIGAPDLTGTTTFTSAGSYPANGQFLIQATETSTVTTFPVYYLFQASGGISSAGTVLATMGPNLPTAQVLCTPSSSNANANIWTIITTPIQAPTSGTSSTSNVIANCVASNGGSLTTAANTFPANQDGAVTAITCTLNIEQAYKGAGYNVPVYGTQANPVTNYANGQVYTNPSQGSVLFGTLFYILSNATAAAAETVTLDPASPPGLTLTQVNSNLLTSATQAWVVSGFTGCVPASNTASSTNYYPCLTVTVDISNADTDSGHVATEFGWVDGQQPSYFIAHLATGGVTTFTQAAGQTGEAPDADDGYTAGLTPTTGNDAAAWGPLIGQIYTSIQSQ